MIPYGKHSIIQADIDAVVDVLENRFLTQGETVPAFEQALCDYTGASYSVAVNSGTSGLHVSCLACGVGPGDIVWTVPNSFVASANCAKYCGADIDFVDIDPITRNISLQALEVKLSEASAVNQLPKALIVVHFAGLSCDMATIAELIKPYAVILIEDAAHGLGGHYLGHKIGSCHYSDMAVLSFHPVKSITTAEGGAVMTNNPKFAENITLFAKHGVTRDPKKLTEQHGPWYYQQHVLGFNYRLSDLQAALGLTQLARIDDFIQRRNSLALRYQRKLAGLSLQLPTNVNNSQSAWHLFMIELLASDRARVFDLLKAKGVGVNVHYIPIHLQPFYQQLGFAVGDYPNAEKFYHRAITLPLYPDLGEHQQDLVIDALHEVIQ
jgi:UDP-4-amino-4,6-dideoxy-N-acetyl-beta-L-altrosamine transaminase